MARSRTTQLLQPSTSEMDGSIKWSFLMPRRCEIPSVVHNFLGTYTSRYSDYRGYWLFGFIVEEMKDLQFDLLNGLDQPDDTTPIVVAGQLAAMRFLEQMEKAKVPIQWVREARLVVSKSHERIGVVNQKPKSGLELRFSVSVVTDLGRQYVSSDFLFVAQHDPSLERRSTRHAE